MLTCIEENGLFGIGLDYTDVHVLGSALLAPARSGPSTARWREARRLKVLREDA